MTKTDLYPSIEPYRTGRLRVSELHEIYFEEVGNPRGVPIAFVHGGPGGGINPDYRRFFDPTHYRIVLFDQRGCGKSTPYADLRENTTWDLVADMEKLRQHLSVDRWFVFGGSWGSTLALIYSETHPASVRGLILRGIFLCRQKEIDWFYQHGASVIFPDAWEHYLAPIPENERSAMVEAYYKRLTSPDRATRLQAARAWSVWEGTTACLLPNLELIHESGADEFAEAFARIECHYFTNHIWLDKTTGILENVHRIRHLPCKIVHGRYDMVCPVESAWELKRAWPECELNIVPDAGHSVTEPGILRGLMAASESFKGI